MWAKECFPENIHKMMTTGGSQQHWCDQWELALEKPVKFRAHTLEQCCRITVGFNCVLMLEK